MIATLANSSLQLPRDVRWSPFWWKVVLMVRGIYENTYACLVFTVNDMMQCLTE
jgi:hypothetical protein